VVVLKVVNADGGDAGIEFFEVFFVPRELAQLDYAERSPVAAVEDEQYAMAAMVGEVERLARLVGEREVRGNQARCRSRLRLGQLHFVEKAAQNEQS
jgi:hypothetical protein